MANHKVCVAPRFGHVGIITVYADDGYPCDFQIYKVSSYDGQSHDFRDSDGNRYPSIKAFAEAKIQEIA